MKLRTLLVCALACGSLLAQAEKKVINVETAGTLSSLVSADDNLTDLTLTGSINKADFSYIKSTLTSVKNLDLKDVTIEACEEGEGDTKVSYPANELPAGVFKEVNTLESLVLPSSITSIGASFMEQTQTTPLQAVDFSNCHELTTIGDHAFSFCSSIKDVDLSGLDKLETIGAYAFDQTDASVINLKGCSSLKTIEERAFMQSYSCKELIMDGCASLNFIGNRAFLNLAKNSSKEDGFSMQCDLSGCTSLATIDESAFQSAKFQTLKLPASLTAIHAKAFNLASGINDITFLSAAVPEMGTSAFSSSVKNRAKVTVPEGSEEAYKAAGFVNVTAATGIGGIHADGADIRLNVELGRVSVEGLTAGQRVSLCRIDGVYAAQVTASGSKLTLSVGNHGMYVVMVGGKAVGKVIL